MNIPDCTDNEVKAAESAFLTSIRNNPNNFSFWFPKIEKCGISVPKSIIIQLPDEIVKSLFLEEPGDDERIFNFVKETVMPQIPDNWGLFFLKNGTFSNKFDFQQCMCCRNAHDITRSIERINMDALCLDTDGETEIIIREFLFPRLDENIEDMKIFKIYNGMPLRPEIRVFYDFDRKKTLYSVNYWDWDYCHDAICERDATDALAYEAAYPTLSKFYDMMHSNAERLVDEHMSNVDMKGIWSVDLMWHDGQFRLIDMAVGYRSAYWDANKIKE